MSTFDATHTASQTLPTITTAHASLVARLGRRPKNRVGVSPLVSLAVVASLALCACEPDAKTAPDESVPSASVATSSATAKATAAASATATANASAAAAAKAADVGLAGLFLKENGDNKAAAEATEKRSIVGGLSVAWPNDWQVNGGNATEGWRRSRDDKAGIYISVDRKASLPDEVKANVRGCNNNVYAITNGKLQGPKVKWEESEKGLVGGEKYPAMITVGFGPKAKTGASKKKPWKFYCITAHVGGNKLVRTTLAVRKDSIEQYESMMVNFVRGWRG